MHVKKALLSEYDRLQNGCIFPFNIGHPRRCGFRLLDLSCITLPKFSTKEAVWKYEISTGVS